MDGVGSGGFNLWVGHPGSPVQSPGKIVMEGPHEGSATQPKPSNKAHLGSYISS
jgi:hypothetical protein